VLAEFFDVAQNKESILNSTVFNQLLQSLILEHETVNLRLDVCEREPYNQISFQRQLSHIEGTSKELSRDHLENLRLCPSQEVRLIHLPQFL